MIGELFKPNFLQFFKKFSKRILVLSNQTSKINLLKIWEWTRLDKKREYKFIREEPHFYVTLLSQHMIFHKLAK